MEEHTVIQFRFNINGQTQTWQIEFWLWVTVDGTKITADFKAGNWTRA